MEASYNAISKEIGYIGYIPFPSIEEMDRLLNSLSLNPTISDFKKALSLYRFTPEAKTEEERRIICMLQLGMAIAKKDLFSEEVEKQRVFQTALNYFLNLIPTMLAFFIKA